MQHLALLARLLLLERGDGPANLQDTNVKELIETTKVPDGIGNLQYQETDEAKQVLNTMNAFVDVFKDDPLVRQGEGMKELSVEYFTISVYLLLRHLRKHYVFAEEERGFFREFVMDFHTRWKGSRENNDPDILRFSEARQQSGTEIEVRHRILRQLFFSFAVSRGKEILDKDERRAFNEAERIAIYRRDDGLCAMCTEEGKPEREAHVPWREFDADHVCLIQGAAARIPRMGACSAGSTIVDETSAKRSQDRKNLAVRVCDPGGRAAARWPSARGPSASQRG